MRCTAQQSTPRRHGGLAGQHHHHQSRRCLENSSPFLLINLEEGRRSGCTCINSPQMGRRRGREEREPTQLPPTCVRVCLHGEWAFSSSTCWRKREPWGARAGCQLSSSGPASVPRSTRCLRGSSFQRHLPSKASPSTKEELHRKRKSGVRIF